MAARAIWKGYLKLSLVSCAVAIYPSTNSSSRIRFNTLNRKTGNRVQRQYIDSETGEPVEPEDQVKGYKVGKGSYILVEDEELDALKLESTHTIDIEAFIPRDEVDERYLDTSYYIAPDDRVAQEAFAVIRDAIRDKGMAGLGRLVMARRERLLLLEPVDQGLMGTTLHSAAEVRDESSIFDEIPEIKYPKEMRDLAAHIIEGKTAHFDPKMFEDRYENALIELVRSKQDGHGTKAVSAPKPSNVVNLMDALRKSIEAEKPATKKAKPSERKKAAPGGRNSAKARSGAGRSKSMKRAS
ncbi:Ku protein [Microvirga sp. GCM10011540]|uniref:non-homologous end joining protein Ku n=1 Tax=Microvirga sp. GCM10011540 TaxID=3317338 RepID=UPI003610002A